MKNEILFDAKFLPMIKDGIKTTTVRSRNRMSEYELGKCDAYDADKNEHIVINIKSLTLTRFGLLTEEVAKTDGFASLAELKSELLTFYPTLADTDVVTIVGFEYVKEGEADDRT